MVTACKEQVVSEPDRRVHVCGVTGKRSRAHTHGQGTRLLIHIRRGSRQLVAKRKEEGAGGGGTAYQHKKAEDEGHASGHAASLDIPPAGNHFARQ